MGLSSATKIPVEVVGGSGAPLPVSDASNTATGTTSYVTTEVTPYTVPVRARILSYEFVGGVGGGDLTLNGGSPIVFDEGEGFGEGPFPATGPAILGEGTVFAWTNADHYFIRLWTPS